MFRCGKQKEMSPLCTVAVTALSVVGAVSLGMLLKKKMGSIKKEMKKCGCECASAMEDAMDTFCDEE